MEMVARIVERCVSTAKSARREAAVLRGLVRRCKRLEALIAQSPLHVRLGQPSPQRSSATAHLANDSPMTCFRALSLLLVDAVHTFGCSLSLCVVTVLL
jgi:hypothetical protein